MWSSVKAMPSEWKVGKSSFSLLVSCQAVLRSTAVKASATAVSVVWWSPFPVTWTPGATAPPPIGGRCDRRRDNGFGHAAGAEFFHGDGPLVGADRRDGTGR